MVYNKIYGQNGLQKMPNWRQFVKDAAAKSIPVYGISVDDMGVIVDVQDYGAAGSRCNFRPTKTLTPAEMRLIDPDWQNGWGNYSLDNPDYNIWNSNNEAHEKYRRGAYNHVEAALYVMPPELDRGVTTVSTWNEPRPYLGWCSKDDPNSSDECQERIDGFSGWADATGWQAYYIGIELINRKEAGLPWFRWAAFAFAGGGIQKRAFGKRRGCCNI